MFHTWRWSIGDGHVHCVVMGTSWNPKDLNSLTICQYNLTNLSVHQPFVNCVIINASREMNELIRCVFCTNGGTVLGGLTNANELRDQQTPEKTDVGETDGCDCHQIEAPETALEAVPVWSSEQFATALKEAGANVILDVRKGMTCLEKNQRRGVALPDWVSKQHVV